MRIIYNNDEGGLSVIIPSAGGLRAAGGDIHKLAQKDVPHGKGYKVIPVSAMPADRSFRDAWEVDPAEMTHGVGAESNSF